MDDGTKNQGLSSTGGGILENVDSLVDRGSTHVEQHRLHRSGWLRAAVLGANDGIVSIASLIVGVAASGASQDSILIAGVAGLVAGAVSMAAGEYVSVKSQQDMERSDLAMEKASIERNPEAERNELSEIYQSRGLEKKLADEVARQFMEHDALDAHARDDIGISDALSARPMQAAFWSSVSFIVGGIVPVISVLLASKSSLLIVVPLLTVVLLFALGALAASAGGAHILKGGTRVLLWGMFAMLLTALVGAIFGVTI